MIHWLFNLPANAEVTWFTWHLRSAWPTWLAVLLLLLAGLFAAGLYRRTHGLTPGRRWTLTGLRAGILTLLIVMLWQPVFAVEMRVQLQRVLLVMIDTSESMAIADRKPGTTDATAIPRQQAVRDALTSDNAATWRALSEDHDLRLFTFDDAVTPLAVDPDDPTGALAELHTAGETTRLGGALEQVMRSAAGRPTAGVVVLTDGANNRGIDPGEIAPALADRDLPVYPVGVGRPDPPDVSVRRAIVQNVVFPGDIVPIRVQLNATGYANRAAELVVRLDGEVRNRKSITLTGEPEFERITFQPAAGDAGVRELTVTVEPLPGEATTENNTYRQDLRVIDEKIRVLYVEGKPRWEYRYLRGVLLRDHRLEVRFLMTEGDADLARYSERHLARFPTEADAAFAFDLVILGDVPASFFTPEQLERLTQLVRQRSGSLLFLAGRRHNPNTFRQTVLESALPVRLPEGRARGDNRRRDEAGGEQPMVSVDESVHPRVTEAGQRAASVTLHADPETNDAIWSLVRPMYELPRLAGAKPGAYVLMALAKAEQRLADYPLVAWQRFGSGKSMYVGTDALWRLRFKRGDTWHARFWAQSIQFLTLSRLLSGANRITLETDRLGYRTGQRVSIFANVLNDVWQPVTTDNYTVRIVPTAEGATDTSTDEAEGDNDADREPTAVQLSPVPDQPGLYQGYFAPQRAGRYLIRAPEEDRPFANEPAINVTSVSPEQREPALQRDELEQLAQRTGGQYLSLRQWSELPDLLPRETLTTNRRLERDLWDLPVFFVLIVLLAGAEWMLRRRWNLV